MIPYNTAVVLAGCALLGLAAGTVGAFALLRGRALVADAVGHAALPGVAIAALISATLGGDPRALPPLLAGAAVAGILGVLAVQALARTRRIREDAAIAIVLSSFYAAGVAILPGFRRSRRRRRRASRSSSSARRRRCGRRMRWSRAAWRRRPCCWCWQRSSGCGPPASTRTSRACRGWPSAGWTCCCSA
jgi:hypothetical protein